MPGVCLFCVCVCSSMCVCMCIHMCVCRSLALGGITVSKDKKFSFKLQLIVVIPYVNHNS